ncbi:MULTISPECIES: exosortase family protein XrtF [Salegentibacter]|uniref:exosortase family protein XrtF n=1 Tax=Salegentibacter TaxID=143222 RepID=UPI00187B55E6|nr:MULTISPECIES: exosortase family protein XrtF [Salegentibacter]MBE7640624.1 exosortase family protein XrtF [Salegentibacter sp. BLCTC]MBI6116946.1 exosortase family protein XrtF [Salegentibacter maritimus]
MIRLFVKYKSVLRFIFMFLGSYLVFTLFYNLYLDFFRSPVYFPDYITHLVAKQSEALINSFGYNAKIIPHQSELSMKLIINEVYLARIIEGCNAVSIIILFLAFVLSFFGKFKTTLLYLLAGSVIIYGMNIIRIAVLAIGIYEYPQHTQFLHSIVFPLIIYGTIFILWLIWVRIYSQKHSV